MQHASIHARFRERERGRAGGEERANSLRRKLTRTTVWVRTCCVVDRRHKYTLLILFWPCLVYL